MRDLVGGWKKKTEEFLNDYGKLTALSSLMIIGGSFLIVIATHITPGELRVSFLDIGQGDAILIQTPSGKQMLIDGGPTNMIITRLSHELSYFDRGIDVIVATHPDADHVTGLIPVLEKYKVDHVVVSPAEGHTGIFDDLSKRVDEERAEVHVARTGDVVDFHDGVTARILYPPELYRAKNNDTNDASVSLLLTYGRNTFLLTGDLPSAREPSLIKNGLAKNITVYKAGHHGSKTSSGELLLTYTRPEYAVISAGKENKYGHPNVEAIDRLQKYSKEILSTIERGTITFITDGRVMEIEADK